MCRRCEIEYTGLRSGKGPALFSKYILGARACKHDPDCTCDKCEQFRDENPYADVTGLLGR